MTNSQITPHRRERIALEIIRVLWGRFGNFPEDASGNRNAPFHKAFLSAFIDKIEANINLPYFISLSSWLHGLNTTLGQSFFENVAHILSNGEKREFTQKKGTSLKITSGQREAIAAIVSDLKNGIRRPNSKLEDEEIALQVQDGQEIDAQDFTVDNFVEENDIIEAIELKSVRPNAGEMQGEKRKILMAKASLRRKYPDKQIRFFFGFPFDPWSDEPIGSDKQYFLKMLIEGDKYLDPEEVLLAGELWDYLSGTHNTMQQIIELINTIATPGFMDTYEILMNLSNVERNRVRYLELLDKWELHRERTIIDHWDYLRSVCDKNKKLWRVLNNSVFTAEGKYNTDRYEILVEQLRNEARIPEISS